MRAQLQTAISLLYPPRCLACGGLVDSDYGLCGTCWRETGFILGLSCNGCGTPLPGTSTEDELCDECLNAPPAWDWGRAALTYTDVGRRLVLGLKHGDRHDIAAPAAQWMARRIIDRIAPDTIVAPIPLHWTRLARRRYNQAALLSRHIAARLNLDHSPDLLHRPRRTKSLDSDPVKTRFAALAGAITLNPRHAAKAKGRPVLLVDDVMTSGATLSAATQACRGAHPREVCVVVLARAVKDA